MSETEPEPSQTSLSETGLEVTRSELLRKRNDEVLSTWALDGIQSIGVSSKLNPFSVGLIGSACAILYLRWALVLGTILAGLVYIFVGAMGFIGLLMIRSPVIRFEYQDQGRVEIPCQESAEDVRQFVALIERHHEET